MSAPLPLEGVKRPRPLAAAARRLLLAAAGRLRRRRAQGRGHRHGRLRPLGAAVLRGRRATTAKSALFLSLNRGKRSIRLDLKTERRPRGAAAPGPRRRRAARVLPPGRARPPRRRLRARCARRTPGLVYCAITGYGQDGPLRDRSGHDMNYLGLNGLLGADRRAPTAPPCRPAGQIADLGGGALMAAFGILAALRERDRTGEGQLVDVSMFDGALSWLAMVAARVFADGERAAARRSSSSAARSLCYRPYACTDGWVTLGALEPKFWQAWCRGVGREDLIEQQFERARLGGARRGRADLPASARATSGRPSPPSTTAAWSPCSSSTRRWTPSSCARARWSSSSSSPGAGDRCALLGLPVKLSRTPGRGPRAGGPALGEHTDEVLRGGRLRRRGDRRAGGVGRGRRPRRRDAAVRRSRAPSWRDRRRPAEDERAGRARRASPRARSSTTCARGCSATARVVRTSRNMAYYPPEFVERIRLIKQLQEERFMPLQVIKGMLDEDPERARRSSSWRTGSSSARWRARARACAAEVRRRYDMPAGRARPPGRARRADARRARLRRRRRGDHRGDRALPRRRLRRGDRLHRLRHAALPRGARSRSSRRRSARCSTASPARSSPTARPRSSPPAPSRCASCIGAMHSKLLLAELRRQRER